MTLRGKYRFLVVAWLLTAASILFLTGEAGGRFFLLFVAAAFFGLLISTLRCPRCRKPVTYNPITKIGKVEIFAWTPTMPKKCTRCGLMLDQKYNPEGRREEAEGVSL